MNVVSQWEDGPIAFSEQADKPLGGNREVWKILIVDDEADVHTGTKLALEDFSLHGRALQFLHAYSGAESIDIMRRERDVALVLMDVVMETEHAGLDAVRVIRAELANPFVRIVLRTGQPGQAPERDVVQSFDINDYKEKTELTAKKLFTLVHTGINHYREMVAMDQSRIGLESVIHASSALFELQTFTQFARGVLQQLAALLYAHRDAVLVQAAGIAATKVNGDFRIVAATGDYSSCEGRMAHDVLNAETLAYIHEALQHAGPLIADHHFAVQVVTKSGIQHVVYLTSGTRFSPADTRLVELYCRNVAIAFENIDLHQEIISSQQQLIVLLSSAIEERSNELRNHVKRVSEYSVALGRLARLAEEDLDALAVAAAMHDLGKIAVPDVILNKPGVYTAEERAVMETHVERGRQMLEGQNAHLLRTASIVVSEHHERWDGCGYPRRLRGDQIHIFGRVASIADVFDALTTARGYKDPWPMQKVVAYFREQRGQHFDPTLVDLFLENLDQFLAIKARLCDA